MAAGSIGVNEGTSKYVYTDTVGAYQYTVTKLDIGAAGASSLFAGTIPVVSALSSGSIAVTAGTGIVTGGSIVVTAGTGVVTGGSIAVTAATAVVTGGSIAVTAGTGVVTGGSIAVTAGTGVVTGGSIAVTAGTVNRLERRAPTVASSFGTLGTAGGSFFGTISAASGAGTVHIVSGVSIVASAGTPEVMVAFGSGLNGGSVLVRGAFPPGGGIVREFNPPIESGTNSELMYHFVNAGTAYITVQYWKTT